MPISWEIFVSTDTVLDMFDESVKTGSIPALTAGGSSGFIPFMDAVWPSFGSYYYVIITISANDDNYGANNLLVSPVVTVPELFTEGVDSTDFGPTVVELFNVTDIDPVLDGNRMDRYQLIKITGLMESWDWDTIKFTLGPGVTTIDIYAEWVDPSDAISLFFWDEGGNEWESSWWDNSGLREPEFDYFTIGGLTEGPNYYVGMDFVDPNVPSNYDLYIRAR